MFIGINLIKNDYVLNVPIEGGWGVLLNLISSDYPPEAISTWIASMAYLNDKNHACPLQSHLAMTIYDLMFLTLTPVKNVQPLLFSFIPSPKRVKLPHRLYGVQTRHAESLQVGFKEPYKGEKPSAFKLLPSFKN